MTNKEKNRKRELYIGYIYTKGGKIFAAGFGIAFDSYKRFDTHRKNLAKDDLIWVPKVIITGRNEDIINVEHALKNGGHFPIFNTGVEGFITEATYPENMDRVLSFVGTFMSDKNSTTLSDRFKLNMLNLPGEERPEPEEIAINLLSNLDIIPSTILTISNDGYGSINQLREAAAKYPLAKITAIFKSKGAYEDAYKLFENNTMVEVLHKDFLTHDFKGKRFDLAIMNPPFTLGSNSQYWKKFVYAALDISDTVAVIGPKGLLGRQFYKPNKNKFLYGERLSFKSLNVGVEICMAIMSKDNKKGKLPYELYVPNTNASMNLETYHKLFNQTGIMHCQVKEYHTPVETSPIMGVMMYKTEDNEFDFYYGDAVKRINDLDGKGKASILNIYKCSEDQSKHIIKTLKKAIKLGVEPYYGFGYAQMMNDFGPIKVKN